MLEAKQQERKPWYILRPDGVAASSRDIIALIALIALYFILPYEIAFVDAPTFPNPYDGLYMFNRIIDLFFLIEMVMEFFIAIPRSRTDEEILSSVKDTTAASAINNGIQYEYRLSHIALHYLTRWLVIDVLAMIPSGFDIYFAIDGVNTARIETEALATSTDTGADTVVASRASRAVKLIKLVRITRLVKILRLLRLLTGLKLIKNMLKKEDSLLVKARDTFLIATVAHARKIWIMQLLLLMLVITHLQACFLGLSAILADEKLESWWGTHGWCFPGELYQLGPDEPFKTRCVPAAVQYSVCYHIAMGFNFGISWSEFVSLGPGEPYWPSESNSLKFQPFERLFFVVVAFCGVLLGMYLTGVFVAIVSGQDGMSVAEEVTLFCSTYQLSARTHRKLQAYFQELEQLSEAVPKPDLFRRLSPTLATSLIYEIHGAWISKVDFMRGVTGCSPEVEAFKFFVCKMAVAMKPAFYIKKERPTTGRFYVTIKGLAFNACTCRLLRQGDTWGSSSIILSLASSVREFGHGGQDYRAIKALTDLQVIYLDRPSFENIVSESPEMMPSYTKLRVWALRRRLLYGIVRAAAIFKGFVKTPNTDEVVQDAQHTGLRQASRMNDGDSIMSYMDGKFEQMDGKFEQMDQTLKEMERQNTKSLSEMGKKLDDIAAAFQVRFPPGSRGRFWAP